VTDTWPIYADECERFVAGHLARPRKLFDAFVARGAGSGRRAGPRLLYWQTVAVFSYGALEAGLEDLVFAAHALRNGVEGDEIAARKNTPTRNPREWIVESRLQNPGPARINKLLFQDFGLLLDDLPSEARFEVRFKSWSKGGSGRGERRAGPASWNTLSSYLETLGYIRNATAHGDASRLHDRSPSSCEGALWLAREDGNWSVQQPHALTALRVVVATFNLIAIRLGDHLGSDVRAHVTDPDAIGYPAT
jgi:hypothetical protein